jgi:crotonobetaine/carnitine-CoA ligase
MLDNDPEFVEAWFACHMIGLISVPINTYMRGPILSHLLSLTEPSVIVTQPRYAERVLDTTDAQARSHVILVLTSTNSEEADESSAAVLADSRAADFSQIVSFDDLRSSAEPERPVLHPGDQCCIRSTGGTTGPSKGIIRPYANSAHLVRSICRAMQFNEQDVLHTCLPLFHGNAMDTTLQPGLISGAEVVLGKHFSVSGFWNEVNEARATHTSLIGSMIPLLLRREPSRIERSHRVTRAQVIPCHADWYELLPRRFGFQPVQDYGISDFSVVLAPPAGEPARPGSCGKVVPGFELAVVGEDDLPVASGEVGELVIRPTEPWISSPGYWRMPAESLAVRRNLWFHTGDLMRREQDGWFFFVDRAKDAIRRRGENVSAWEVEQVVLQVPGILECAVYAVPSELTEDDIALAVVTNTEALTPRGIIEQIEPRLPYFAVPRYVRLLESLPKSPTQRVLKQELRDQGIPEGTWDLVVSGYQVSR